MFGTNRPACVAGGAKRCPRGGFPRADSASPVCSVKNVCRKLRAGPARVPQDAAFSEKQNADRPRRGVMRPQPPHRAGFLCRLPVFRVLTAWQAKGRPKSVRFCADYEKSRRLYAVRVRNSRAPQGFIGPARRRVVSSDGQRDFPRGRSSSKRANGRLQSIAFLRAVAEPLWRRFRASAHIGVKALFSFEKAVEGLCSKAFFGRTAYRPPKGRPVCRSLIQPVALRLYSALPWMGWRSAGVKVPVRALKRHSGSCPSEKCQYSV